MYTTFLADHDHIFSKQLAEAIEQDGAFDLLGVTHDGQSALELIMEQTPELILLDPLLERMDGFHILKKIRAREDGYAPRLYVLSAISTDTSARLLNQLNIDYFTLKPTSPGMVVENMHQIMDSGEEFVKPPQQALPRPKSGKDSQTIVYQLFQDLGIPTYLMSARRTQEAILLCLEDDAILRQHITSLYQQVGRLYGATHQAIERSIRSSVRSMVHADTARYAELFGGRRITNSVFMGTVVNYVRQQIVSQN